MTKANAKKFLTLIQKELISIGAILKSTDELYFNFTLETKVGNINIFVPKEQSIVYSVYARFDNVQVAKEVCDCNPHSGKYNAHISGSASPIDACIDIAGQYEALLNLKSVK